MQRPWIETMMNRWIWRECWPVHWPLQVSMSPVCTDCLRNYRSSPTSPLSCNDASPHVVTQDSTSTWSVCQYCIMIQYPTPQSIYVSVALVFLKSKPQTKDCYCRKKLQHWLKQKNILRGHFSEVSTLVHFPDYTCIPFTRITFSMQDLSHWSGFTSS